MNDEQLDYELLAAVRDFALDHPDPKVEKFKASMRDWGDEYRPASPDYLPAADCLEQAAANANSPAQELLGLFARHKRHLLWEQSYSKQDGVVSDAMLANYGFAEILGNQGPFVSARIRAGIGIYGPGIEYPRHRHQAEEVYIPLTGSACFNVGGTETEGGAGEVILVPSNTAHGFITGDTEALVVYYLWQAGDLRQISSFG